MVYDLSSAIGLGRRFRWYGRRSNHSKILSDHQSETWINRNRLHLSWFILKRIESKLVTLLECCICWNVSWIHVYKDAVSSSSVIWNISRNTFSQQNDISLQTFEMFAYAIFLISFYFRHIWQYFKNLIWCDFQGILFDFINFLRWYFYQKII